MEDWESQYAPPNEGSPSGDRASKRIFARSIAKRHADELWKVASSGGNPFHRANVHSDEVNEITSGLSSQDAMDFTTMYAQELDAFTKQREIDINNDIIEKQTRIAKEDVVLYVVIIIVGAFVLFSWSL